MNQQKYYCKECGREISEYTNSSNRGMCYSCSQNAYYSDLADRLKDCACGMYCEEGKDD